LVLPIQNGMIGGGGNIKMGSTINMKKITPDKDLAILGGLIKGLNTRKKEMEDAQAKKQETAMKWYEAFQKAQYNQSMAESRSKDVESQIVKRTADIENDMKKIRIDSLRAEADIQNSDTNRLKFIEEKAYNAGFYDREKHKSFLTMNEDERRITLTDAVRRKTEFDTLKLKNIYDTEQENLKQAGRIDEAKATGGYQLQGIGIRESGENSRLIEKQNQDVMMEDIKFAQDMQKEKYQVESGKYAKADSKRSDLSPAGLAYEKAVDNYNKAIQGLPTGNTAKAENLLPLIDNLEKQYSSLMQQHYNLKRDYPQDIPKVTPIRNLHAVIVSADRKKILSGEEAERGMYGGMTAVEFYGQQNQGTVTPSTTTGLTPTQITWIETQKKKKLTNQQIIDATPSNLKEEVKKRLENE
jgi:hypothetical protein